MDHAIRLSGIVLVVTTVSVITVGPSLMSRETYTALQLFFVMIGAAYGIFLAAHSRTMHVGLERAYSAHLEELSQRLRNMAYRDAVTGLYNHRYFREQLSHELERSARYAQPLSMILMDMNNFKEINDRYGHFMGDKFLGLVGEVIDRHIRGSDVGARYGGDEFVIVLPNTTTDEAALTGNKLVTAVASCAAMTASGESVELGVSYGVASFPSDAKTAGELIQQADARLYAAKADRRVGRRRGRSSVA
ncbi:MAG: GGDEF domain-containing protein [Dehalococcoidia bacterium]